MDFPTNTFGTYGFAGKDWAGYSFNGDNFDISVPLDVPAYWAAKTNYTRNYCPANVPISMVKGNFVTPAFTDGDAIGRILEFQNNKYIAPAGMATPTVQTVSPWKVADYTTSQRNAAASLAFSITAGYGLIMVAKFGAGMTGTILKVNDGDLNVPDLAIISGNIHAQVFEDQSAEVPVYSSGLTVLGLWADANAGQIRLVCNGVVDDVTAPGEQQPFGAWATLFMGSDTTGNNIVSKMGFAWMGIDPDMSLALFDSEVAEARLHWSAT